TLSRGRGKGFATCELRAAVESGVRDAVSASGAGSGARVLYRFRSHAGCRASGQRRQAEDSCRELAALHAGSRLVAPEGEAQALSPTAGAEGSLRRTGAAGRELSWLAGRAGRRSLSDAHDRRCHQHRVCSVLRAGDDLGGGPPVARLDRTARYSARTVHGLEERVRASGDYTGAVRRHGAADPVRTHVPEAGISTPRPQPAAGKGARRANARHASGPANKEAAAA